MINLKNLEQSIRMLNILIDSLGIDRELLQEVNTANKHLIPVVELKKYPNWKLVRIYAGPEDRGELYAIYAEDENSELIPYYADHWGAIYSANDINSLLNLIDKHVLPS